MDKKDIQQLKTKPVAELQKLVVEGREKLWSLKDGLLNGKVKNVKEIRDVRKDIARLLTFIKQNNGTK